MGSHPYLRFLARVSAKQPLLRPPPEACLTQVSPSDLLGLMPYTHPISGYRSRSFEQRGLELRIAELPPAPEQPPARGSPRAHEGAAAAPAAPADVATASAAASAKQAPATGASTAPANLATRASNHPGGGAARGRECLQAATTPAVTAPLPGAGRTARGGSRGGTTADTSAHTPGAGPRVRTDHPTAGGTFVAAASTAGGGGSPTTSPQNAAPHAALHAPPPHSYMEVRYPFTSLPCLWKTYHRPGFPGLDPALIIEDLDTFAADVAARHVGHIPDSMLVTAFLERLTWHLHLRPGDGLAPLAAVAAVVPGGSGGAGDSGGGDSGRGVRDGRRLAPLAPMDMRLAGQVTWVGRSSMEVLLQLTTVEPPAAAAAPAAGDTAAGDGAGSVAAPQGPPSGGPPSSPAPQLVLPPGRLIATAEFVMALRDLSLRRAVDVPPLHPRDALERELFHRGREHQCQRQARRDRDRDGAPVTAVATAAAGPASPPRGPAAAVAPTSTAAHEAGAAGAAPELARMLYDNLLRSELCRMVPTDSEALRLLDLEPLERDPCFTVEVEVTGEEAEGEELSGARAKRRRMDVVNESCTREWRPRVPILAAATAEAAAAAAARAVAPIRETEVHRTVIAEFQDRNTSDTVFGGHLLRLAYEHAATAAAAHAGAPCELLWMEEGAISSPARVGDVLHAVARVVWAEPGGRALRVVVRIGKYDVAAPSQHILALTLAAAFLAPAPLEVATEAEAEVMVGGGRGCGGGVVERREGGGLREVVPTTLVEASESLAAIRRHEAAMAALAAAEAEVVESVPAAATTGRDGGAACGAM